MEEGRLIIGFTGPSGIGKTTLLERVVATLVGRGVKLGVIKHASHTIQPDVPGKDSFRLYQAGADAVVLSSPEQITTFARRVDSGPRLDDALRALPPGLDLVLVEGYLSAALPRYVLVAKGEEMPRPYLDSGTVLRIIHPPAPLKDGPPAYDPALVKEVVAEILDLLATETRGA